MENTILEFVQIIHNVVQREIFELPSRWDPSHQICLYPFTEGVGHAEMDGAKKSEN
jgi:hypothetical protein